MSYTFSLFASPSPVALGRTMVSQYYFEVMLREAIRNTCKELYEKTMQAVTDAVDSNEIKTLVDRQAKEYINSPKFKQELGRYLIDTNILELMADMLEARRMKDNIL